jgi:hypothetical protein
VVFIKAYLDALRGFLHGAYMSKDQEKKYLKTSAAATYLDISVRYLQDLSESGIIPVSKVSKRCHLYAIADLDKFVEDGRE